MVAMAKRKNNTGRARDEGEVKFVGAELEPALISAIEKCMEKERRTKRAVITLALEEYLTRAGLWPPKR